MFISEIKIDTYNIPLPEPVEAYAAGVMKSFDLVVCRITNDDEVEGVGYITVHENQGKAIAQIIKDSFIDLLKNKDPRYIEYLWNLMWKKVHYAGRGAPVSFAIAAVDVALWDLKGKYLNEPLWSLLGGYQKNVLCYAGNIDLNFSKDKLLAEATKSLNQGFRAIKMRLGRVNQAMKAFNEIEKFNLVWLEEPIKPDDFEGYKYLRSLGKVPIAAGENLHTLAEINLLIKHNGVDYVEPDLTTCGGITTYMKVAKLAEINNLPVVSHGVHELHVHLLAACPNASYMEFHAWRIDDYIEEKLSINNGYSPAPDKPGHGVVFDFEKLSKLKID